MSILIVESPAKCKKIQSFLDNSYIVKSSVGHIRTLDTKWANSDIKIEDDILVLLENQNRVVRISDSIVYHYDVYKEMVQRIQSHLESFKEISVAEVRDMFKASRKYALALMEYLDARQVTKRIGDKRILF